MAATLRRTFRYPGEDDHPDGGREELDEQGQIPLLLIWGHRRLKLYFCPQQNDYMLIA